ncbi:MULTISPECIES: isoprenylcysteine carboxylmethyltransferase family protein [unclassified Fusibacter]|uniref:methyltransferase family protein n=1 Tax=unclassified Fusibacter TaxID=2624464 RepID=UPI001012FA96|nr:MULTISPECIES: isoprenylcysteine carboxylmethyltransferase family protein [unclassified Fusibacter]MCK8058358.1 isoprenylcysteine carboxylmethyltransferase family protein [Fusibacter sp. A2]NPE20941.1 isoprenylcysteine carboxylmethyltransferase family protein [Fusibacter sp. A1]RXV63143.1 isoprenylcysteine carboxylmethyltransferase family protein [Fusibacter sp. A1]
MGMTAFGNKDLIIYTSVPVAITCLTAAILINFLTEDKKRKVSTYKKTWVDTFSMYGVALMQYVAFVLGARGKLGLLVVEVPRLIQWVSVFLIYFALIVNLTGRLKLKSRWSNMIKIDADHTAETRGVFKFVRHPLYASIMLMMAGAGLVYGNLLILAILVIVFYPMMTHRAKLEENELLKLEGYEDYMNRTGRFIPRVMKIWRSK